jgi:hypothetical protein
VTLSRLKRVMARQWYLCLAGARRGAGCRVTAGYHRPGGSGEVRPASAAAPGSVRTREGAALADAPGTDGPPPFPRRRHRLGGAARLSSRFPARPARALPRCSRAEARRWRAGGAPLMTVKKILTASTCWLSDRREAGSFRYRYSGQSNRAQMVRPVWSPSIPHSSATARTMSSPWCLVGSTIPWFQGPPLSRTSIRA